MSDMQGIQWGTLETELTVKNGYDLFSFHGRVVGIVCFPVDDVHVLGLWFRLRCDAEW